MQIIAKNIFKDLTNLCLNLRDLQDIYLFPVFPFALAKLSLHPLINSLRLSERSGDPDLSGAGVIERDLLPRTGRSP